MRRILTEKLASKGLIILLSLVIIFHTLVLVNLVPYNVVWGGRINNREELIRFELISIAANIVMLAIVLIYAKRTPLNINARLLKIAFWLMFILFLLNTFGNILSTNNFESIVFTPLTIILSLFCLRLAVAPSDK